MEGICLCGVAAPDRFDSSFPIPIYGFQISGIPVSKIPEHRFPFYRTDGIPSPEYSFKYKLSPCTLYTVMVAAQGDFDEYTMLVYDFKNNRQMIRANYPTGQTVQLHFITGQFADELMLCIYTGIAGKTQGNILLIRSLTVMAMPMRSDSTIPKKTNDSTDQRKLGLAAIGERFWPQECDEYMFPGLDQIAIQYLLQVYRPNNILELGMDESSKQFAVYTNSVQGGYLVLDEDKEWCQGFLCSNKDFFKGITVYISPLLRIEKGGFSYCIFRDFERVAGSQKFDFILLRRPREGNERFPHIDILSRIPEILSQKFLIIIEQTDCIEEQFLLQEISKVLSGYNIITKRRYILGNHGEICLISTCEEESELFKK